MNRTRVRGFSLIEALLAVAILGIGLVGITQALTLSLRASKDAERHSVAPLLASGQLELLRADGFLAEGETEGDFSAEGFPLYRWRRNIESTDLDGLFAVTLEIQLADSGESLCELETLIFETPLPSTISRTELRRGSAARARPGAEAR